MIWGIEIPVCGMVKDDHHRTRGLYFNNLEIPLIHTVKAFRLITRIRMKPIGFAIEFHRSLRSKEQVHSCLDDIPGIGDTGGCEKSIEYLMHHGNLKTEAVENSLGIFSSELFSKELHHLHRQSIDARKRPSARLA